MTTSVFQRLTALLDSRGAPYDLLRHEPVFTSAEAANARGAALASGAKALICKADSQFVMFVMPADRRLASKRVRKSAKIKSLRFASRDEVTRLTSLAPGSIPPFGGLFNLPTWCDSRLQEQVRINFNAGDHAISISMTYEAYRAVEDLQLGDYSDSPDDSV